MEQQVISTELNNGEINAVISLVCTNDNEIVVRVEKTNGDGIPVWLRERHYSSPNEGTLRDYLDLVYGYENKGYKVVKPN